MNTIQSQWQGFAAQTIPPNAAPEQVQDLCRTFYAGATAVLSVLQHVGNSKMTPQAGNAVIQGLIDEAALFAELQAGGQEKPRLVLVSVDGREIKR